MRLHPHGEFAKVLVFVERDGGGAITLRTRDGAVAWKRPGGVSLLSCGVALTNSGRLLEVETGDELGEVTAAQREAFFDAAGNRLLVSMSGSVWPCWQDGLLVGVSLPDAKHVWKRDFVSEVKHRFGVESSVGYLHSSEEEIEVLSLGALFGLDKTTGEAIWCSREWRTQRIPESHRDRLLGVQGNSFICLDRKTGGLIFQAPMTPPAFFVGSQVIGDFALAGFESGHIFCFDVRDGRLAWTTQIKGGLWGFKSMSESLFVTTLDGRLLKFSGDPSEPPETGVVRRKWQKPSGTFFRVSQSPRARLEIEAAKKTKSEQEKGFAKTNADTARALVFRHSGRRIGKGIEGLANLDECITNDLRAEERGIRLRVEPAPATVFLFGCLVGEILIELFGGTWVTIGEGDVAIDIPLGEGKTAQANVLGKVLKLFQNGPEDSVTQLAEALAAQVAAAKASPNGPTTL